MAGHVSAIANSPSPPHILLRYATPEDVTALSDLLVQGFHGPLRLDSWIYHLLRVGIYEDLRYRLNHAAQLNALSARHSSPSIATPGTSTHICWVAQTVLQSPPHSSTPYSSLRPQRNPASQRLIGTVELDIRPAWPWEPMGQTPSLLDWLTPTSRYLYLSNLAVPLPYRRQGVARKLLDACELTAQQWGFSEIYLHVMEDNQAAQNLYTQAGYTIHPQGTDWPLSLEQVRQWLGRPRRLLMRKQLGQRGTLSQGTLSQS